MDRKEIMSRASSSRLKKDQEKKIQVSEYLKRLDASTQGLSQEEAERRIAQYGYNELEEKRISPVLKFFSYFWGPIPWMIEVAAVLSLVVRHWADFGIILVLLLANAVVGFWEEYKADNTIAELQAQLAPNARVKRDGKWSSIPARQLVPGDIVRLRIGDIIPADVILLEGDPLQVDQSALTGESLPVTREKGEEVYSGSIIKLGEIDALVHATGTKTYMGKTARLVEEAKKTSHFQRAVLKIGDYLIFVALFLVILILAAALFRADNMITVLQFVLVLTVAAIPVAMPTVLSITMAVGAQILARDQAVVSRLASIEELAGIDILCSDKTGTLTQNKLELGDPYSIGDIAPNQVILDAALASREEDQDPIDLAVLRGMENKDLSSFKIVHFQPFDPVQKRTEAQVKDSSGKEFKVSKGAPQVILDMVEIPDETRSECEKKIDEFAKRGFRSLGVAHTDNQNKWRLRGVLPLYDPPREDSKETIEKAQNMGVDVKMVTGDQVAIQWTTQNVVAGNERTTGQTQRAGTDQLRHVNAGAVAGQVLADNGFPAPGRQVKHGYRAPALLPFPRKAVAEFLDQRDRQCGAIHQVAGARLAMTQNIGGSGASVVTHILEACG